MSTTPDPTPAVAEARKAESEAREAWRELLDSVGHNPDCCREDYCPIDVQIGAALSRYVVATRATLRAEWEADQ